MPQNWFCVATHFQIQFRSYFPCIKIHGYHFLSKLFQTEVFFILILVHLSQHMKTALLFLKLFASQTLFY